MAETNLKIMDEGVRNLIFTRFQTIMGFSDENRDVLFWPKEVALRNLAEKRGKTEMEFANVWRTGIGRAIDRQRTPIARQGISVTYTDGAKTDVGQIKAMPADLMYSVWFWSKDRDKLNQVAESMLFWKQQDPNMHLIYTFLGTDFPLEYDMKFEDIVDESPIDAMFDRGLYDVMRFNFTVEGWVFDSETLKTIQKVILKVYQDIDPNGPHERDILLFEQEYDLTV
jgi:hypothetical protein